MLEILQWVSGLALMTVLMGGGVFVCSIGRELARRDEPNI
jgi:hypothetical protein